MPTKKIGAVKKRATRKLGVVKPASTSIALPSATPEQTANWLAAVRAAEAKKANDIKVLDLREITAFTDFFVLCNGTNPKQIQAIADEIGQELKRQGELPSNVEGYNTAEWILLDYGDFVVHVFSEKARHYYDLERLWREAKLVGIPAA